MERNNRRTFIGRVVSDKMDKTITVLVETKKDHPVYKKKVKSSKKYKAHDENNVAQLGDKVKKESDIANAMVKTQVIILKLVSHSQPRILQLCSRSSCTDYCQTASALDDTLRGFSLGS